MEDSGIDSDSKSNCNDLCRTPEISKELLSPLHSQGTSSSPKIPMMKNNSCISEGTDDMENPDCDDHGVTESLLSNSSASASDDGILSAQPTRTISTLQLQKRLEQQIQKAKKMCSQVKTDNSEMQKRSLIPHSRLPVPMKPLSVPIVSKADEQPLVTWETESDEDEEFHLVSKQTSKEINQQLRKDGYNLDLTPDDEDLDLIPPKPLNERCFCCSMSYPCTIM